MKKRILLMEPIHKISYLVFGDNFDVRVAPNTSVEIIKKEIQGVHGVLVRMAPLTGEMIEAANCLQIISKHGVGIDNIDVQTATKKGILVVNTGDANSISVAEHTLIAMGTLTKKIFDMDRAVREGNWERRMAYSAMDLEGKTLGLIGLGRIGCLVAKKAQEAFCMKILAYDPYIMISDVAKLRVRLVDDLDRIFKESDVISLHIPLTEETKGLVNKKRISLMKPSAFLLNFSRGEVVDERVLYTALKEKRIGGAALDVFQQEPLPKNSPFCKLDNVLLSPHSAMATKECILRLAKTATQGIVDFFNGKQPKFVVNPEVLKKN